MSKAELSKKQAASSASRGPLAGVLGLNQQLSLLDSVSQIASRSLEIQDILDGALTKALEALRADAGTIYILGDDQQARLASYLRLPADFAQEFATLEANEGTLMGTIARSGQPLATEDLAGSTSELAREIARRWAFKGYLGVPLKSRGKVVGILGLVNHEPRLFSEEEIEIMGIIGNQIGVAIEMIRLYQEERNIAERLRVSQAEYQELFDDANDAIFVYDTAGRLIVANRSAARLLGHQRQELEGMNIAQLLTSGSLEAIRNLEKHWLQGQQAVEPVDIQVARRDGSQLLLEGSLRLIYRREQPLAFQIIARDVTERRQMQKNMESFADQTIIAQEEERRRLARELHDDTLQDLLVVSHRLKDVTAGGHGHLTGQVQQYVEATRQLVDNSLVGLRRFIQDLRPTILDDMGLVPAIKWLSEKTRSDFGFNISLKVEGEECRLSPPVELVLFRVAQEALSNSRRHSAVSLASIAIVFRDYCVRMVATDHGHGFDIKKAGQFASEGNLGLMGMVERVRLVNGTIKIRSAPGRGTVVSVEIPTA